jgi:protein O-GlcNAc transferase
MSDIAVPSSPSMSGPETDLFLLYMRQSQRYLEFGSGGSTSLAARIKVPRLFSVESDRLWAAAVEASPLIRPRIDDGTYTIRWIDIGETKTWGFPAVEAEAIKWPRYSTSIWNELDFVPDLVLVDGRFRVSCALQSFAHCANDTLVAVHDFEREDYHLVLRYAEVVDRVERLIVLRRRPDIDSYQFGIDCVEQLLNPL